MGQNDAASQREVHAKLEGEMQAKLAALEASMQRQVEGLAAMSDAKLSKLKGEVVVDVVLPPPSALTRFCVSMLAWAGMFLLAYAYVYGGNCDCMMGKAG